MNKILLIFALIFIPVLSGCKTPSQEAQLEEKCNELTKSNKEGRVYEVIVGKFLLDKYRGTIVQSFDPTEYSTKFSLSNSGEEVVIHSEKMKGDELYNEHKSFLEKVIHIRLEEPNFENYIFGICAYKDEEGKYMDQIDTLTFLGDVVESN